MGSSRGRGKKRGAAMGESLKRYFTREEEFLEECYSVASAAVTLLGDDWHPNPSCNDAARENQEYLLRTGELMSLVFEGAAVYHDADLFSSARLVLKSSERSITVSVRQVGGELIAERNS
jgi:hypothetical protein